MDLGLSSSRTETMREERRGQYLREVSIAHPISWIGLIAAQGLQSTCPVPSAIAKPSAEQTVARTHELHDGQDAAGDKTGIQPTGAASNRLCIYQAGHSGFKILPCERPVM